jgi:hypothetical protein
MVSDFTPRPVESSNTLAISRHVAILLDVTLPVFRIQGELPNSWGMLLSMLGSIVEHMPKSSFRVIVFDSEQQRVLFRKENFTLTEDMDGVERTASAAQRWAVDYHSLQNSGGGWNLVRDLEHEEISGPASADTVVFLGVQEGRFSPVPPGMPNQSNKSHFFFLKYGTPPTIPGLGMVSNRGIEVPHADGAPPFVDMAPQAPSPMTKPGLVEQSVEHLKGKVFLISSPKDFSKAFAAITR